MNLKKLESVLFSKKTLHSCSFLQSKKETQKVPFLSGYALKTGVHIGHKSLRLSKTNFWHPLMAQYLLGIRHRISLIDPIQTRKCLLRAFFVIALVLKKNNNISPSFLLNKKENDLLKKKSTKFNNKVSKKELNRDKSPETLHSKNGLTFDIVKSKAKDTSIKPPQSKKSTGHILIVNTNPEFSRLCKNINALTLDDHRKNNLLNITTQSLSYVHYKWVGGTLTNWKQVSKSVLTYAKFAARCEKFLYNNNIDFSRYKKIKECFRGLVTKKQGKVYLAFNEKPDLVFLMNPNENRHIIAEANKKHIPVIALVESNTYLKGISYPIPANAYSAFFIYYCLKKILKLSTI